MAEMAEVKILLTEVETVISASSLENIETIGKSNTLMLIYLEYQQNLSKSNSDAPNFHKTNGGVDDFFDNLELNKYLARYVERYYDIHLDNIEELNKLSKYCLRAAIILLRNAQENYQKFSELSKHYNERLSVSESISETRANVKRFFGIGTEAKYKKMTEDAKIPPSLYFFMLVFAFGLLYFELEFRDKYLKEVPLAYENCVAMIKKIKPLNIYTICREAVFNSETSKSNPIGLVCDNVKTSIIELLETTSEEAKAAGQGAVAAPGQEAGQGAAAAPDAYKKQKAPDAYKKKETPDAYVEKETYPLLAPSKGGASRRHTRHHRRNSSHSRKSVIRNKKSRKGRKVKKMHRTKHRVHRRNQNKSKTKTKQRN